MLILFLTCGRGSILECIFIWEDTLSLSLQCFGNSILLIALPVSMLRQVYFVVVWGLFFPLFFSVFCRGRLGATWLHLGAILEVFGSFFRTFFEVCQNSLKYIPSAAKTMFLRFGEGPESHISEYFWGMDPNLVFYCCFVIFWCPGGPKGLPKSSKNRKK